MRHQVAKKKLSRTPGHRNAMAKTMASQLILNGKMDTTETKAKWIKPYVEQVVTKAAKVNKENKIDVFNTVKYLKTKLVGDETISKLMNEVAPVYIGRKGGYTRIIKTGNRDGDNARTARIEFVKGETANGK